MTIKFKCSACESALSAPDEMAGRKAKCRQCGGAVQVPNPAADRWPPGMAPRAVAPQAPSGKSEPPPPPAPATAASVPQATVATSPPQRATTQAQVPIAQAVPVVPATLSQSPPPLAIPVATPLDSLDDFSSLARPDRAERKPLDDIADMLDFEKSAPRVSATSSAEDNPYQGPRTTAPSADRRSDKDSSNRLRFGDTLRTTWTIFKKNLGACVGATAVLGIGFVAAHFIFLGTFYAFGLLITQFKLNSVALANIMVVLFLALNVLSAIFFTLGFTKFMLQLARGKPAEFSMLFGSTDLLFSGLGVLILVLAATGIGTLLLLIPGILAAIMFSLAPIALVDKEEGAIAALSYSAKLTTHNLLPVFLLMFCTSIVCNLVSTFTCGMGGLFAMPFQTLLAAVIYLRAAGRRTAVD